MRTLSKRAAKAILPRGVLQLLRAFRHDSGEIWESFFSRRVARRLQAGVLHSRTARPFTGVDRASFSPAVVSALLDPWLDWHQRETIAVYKGSTFIEPRGGWIIASPAHLVTSCLIDPSSARKPSFRKYLRTRLSARRAVKHEPRLIHLRDWGEANYWHFLNDILGGRLRLAESAGIDTQIPLLIGRRAFEQPFVQEILRDTEIGRRRFVIQEDELVHCREVVHFETPRHSIESTDFVLKCLGARGGTESGNKRVFLSRRWGSPRTLENLPEIEEACRRWRFEIVDTEGMSLAEQISLFSQVRYLVAIHGAGLANMMFRRGAPLALLELFPATTYLSRTGRLYPPPAHYFWLSHACGYRYDAIFASPKEPGDFASAFRIDPATLDLKIQDMLR